MSTTASASDADDGHQSEGRDRCVCGCSCRAGTDVGHPFGLSVLSEVPELADALSLMRQLDRMQAELVGRLARLTAEGTAESATGVGLDQWLATIGQATRSDRRMLRTTVKVLRRLPSVAAAFDRGEVSWSQLRMLVLKVDPLPRRLDTAIDAELAAAIAEVNATQAPADPDALARVVTWVLAELDPAVDEADLEPAEDVLVLQPRLDGTGGRYWGEAGPVGFALLDAATDPGPAPMTTSKAGFGDPTDLVDDEDARTEVRQARTRAARARAGMLYRRLAGHTPDAANLPPVTLLARAELSTLLDRQAMPTQLLTTLAGGRMRLTSSAAKQLVDAHGADLRLIVADHGKVVGIGRRSRQPPGWLRDATLALHDTCSEPGCTTAATVCDLDHATPWTPDGRTDIDQLAPLCRPANRTKERDGWTATQTADGVRTWRHQRSGIATITLPSTWRPPPPRAGPDPGDGDRDPRAGPDPGGTHPPDAPPREPPDETLPF